MCIWGSNTPGWQNIGKPKKGAGRERRIKDNNLKQFLFMFINFEPDVASEVGQQNDRRNKLSKSQIPGYSTFPVNFLFT